MKTKLSAVAAIVATVFGVMAGGVPAHATGYASNANSVSGSASLAVQVDSQGHVTLPSGLTEADFRSVVTIDGTDATSRIGQTINAAIAISDPANANVPSSPMGGPYMSSTFTITFFNSLNMSLGNSSSNTPPSQAVVPANTTKIVIEASAFVMPSTGTLSAGQYTMTVTNTSNSAAIALGAHVVAERVVTYNVFNTTFTNPTGMIISGNYYSSHVDMLVCVTSAVTSSSTITPHVTLNGTTLTSSDVNVARPFNITNAMPDYSGSYQNYAAFTPSSSLVSAGLAYYVSLPVSSANSSNVYDISLTDGSNTEVTAPCSSPVPTTPTASATPGAISASLVGLSYSGSYACNLYLSTSPSTPVSTIAVPYYQSSCSFSGLTAGNAYFVKLTGQAQIANESVPIYGKLATSAASNTVTVPAAGLTLTAPSGGTTSGSAQVLSTLIDTPSGTTNLQSASDGGDGILYSVAIPNAVSGGTDYSVKIGHLTASGADTSFAGGGTANLTSVLNIPSGMNINGFNPAPAIGWYGNRTNWSVGLQSTVNVGPDFALSTGSFASSTVNTITVSNSVAAAYCATTFGSGAGASSIRPVSMATSVPVWLVSCYKSITLIDNSSRNANSAALVTIPNSTTINTLAAIGGLTSSVNVYTLKQSANPAATGSAIAFTGVAITGQYVSSSNALVVNRSIVRIASDLTVTTSASTYSSATAFNSNEISIAPVNSGTTYAVYGTTSARLATLGTTGDVVMGQPITFDSNAAIAFTPYLASIPTMVGAAPTAAPGYLFFTRSISMSSYKVAPFKVEIATGNATTGEVVTYTSSASMGMPPSFLTAFAFTSSGQLNWFYTSTANGTKITQARWATMYVPAGPSSDASATISVNDGSAHTVQNNGTLNVANGVTSVTTTVTPTESHATVGTITGGNNLQVGNNTVSFTVTAQDGSTQNYSFTVVRAAQVMPTYVLTFDKNNQSATGTMATVSSSSSWAIPNSAGYSLTGYSFNGWNTLANGNGTSYAAGAPVNLTADLTLYAQWLIDPFVLTFDKNNNSATGSQAALSSRTNWSTPATVGYSLSGYLFDGWTTNANGTGTSYGSNAAVTLTQNTTLYAKWTQIPNDAVLCSVGTYSSHGGYRSTSNSWTCTDAPAGSFVATAGALTANLCPAGYFSAAAASTACTPASVGHFVASAGSTAEVACPANTHAYATGAAACDPDRVLSGNNNAKVVIGGKVVAPGATLRLTGAPNGLNVNVEMSDNRARAYVTVPANPVVGDNLVTVFVEAENGSVAETTVIVHIDAPVVTPPVVTPPVVTPPVVTPPVVTPPVVTPPVVTPPAKSSDATAVITVAGITVADGDHVNLPFGTASVPVVVTPTESHATFAVTGATGLQTGTSVLTVTVTAEDGTVKAYSYQLVVAADKSPVNLGTANTSVLQQVTAALDAGRVALFSVTAKGAASASKVLAQIRAFKTDLRAAGSTAKVSFSIKGTGANAVASVKVAP